MINIQKEYVTESRENLAIARVREKMGKCGQEEAMRWATQLYEQEQQYFRDTCRGAPGNDRFLGRMVRTMQDALSYSG